MLSRIRVILIISTPDDTPRFEALLGDGSPFGISLSYCVQPSPGGLTQVFLLRRKHKSSGMLAFRPTRLLAYMGECCFRIGKAVEYMALFGGYG